MIALHDQRRHVQVFQARAEVVTRPVAQQRQEAQVPLRRLQRAAITAQHLTRYLCLIEPRALDRAGAALVAAPGAQRRAQALRGVHQGGGR